MPTYVPRATDIRNDWYLLNGDDQVLGRLATRAAVLLMGKHKPDYTPFLKTGDFVIVVNAQKVKLTGKKEEQKKYYSHSGYPGGLKETSAREMRAKHPERMVESAILGSPLLSMFASSRRRTAICRAPCKMGSSGRTSTID